MKRVTFIILSTLDRTMSVSVKKPSLRIIDGRDALPGEYPYAVRIEEHKSKIFENETKTQITGGCSGAAITATWTLTAKHCSDFVPVTRKNKTNYIEEFKYMIRYGNPHLKPSDLANNQLAAILITKRPAMPTITPKIGDIALLLTEPVSLYEFAKVSAVDYRALVGYEVAVMGFGIMRANKNAFAFNRTQFLDKPLQVMKAVMKNCEVTNYYGMWCALPLCRTVQSAFAGDSGGPVVHPSGVIGVISMGTDGFLHRLRPSFRRVALDNIQMITPVSPYLEWIYFEMHSTK